MNRFWLGCILLICSGVSASAFAGADRKSGQITVAAAGANELPPPDSTTDVGVYKGVSEYRIGPSDLLEINVFQVADLNRTVRVNTSGDISLPLIGVVKAGGRTLQELEAEIAKRLDTNFLQNPQVTVFVKEFTSQRVTLEGAIKTPGIYPLTGKTTLLQAIAMAQGLDPLADLKGIVIFRVVDGKKMGARFDIKAIRSGNASDPQVYGDDIIVVDQSGSKTAFRRIMESLPIFNMFTIL